MLNDKEKVLRQWPDAHEQRRDGKTRIVLANPECPNAFLRIVALSEDFDRAEDAWNAAARRAEARKRVLDSDPEAIHRKERIEVHVGENRYIVLLKKRQPVGILIPHAEEEPRRGDALLTESEKQEIYTAALEALAHLPKMYGH